MNGERWIKLHARRFKEHPVEDPNCEDCINYKPFPHDHHTCMECLELIQTGEWTLEKGGYDSTECLHVGCNYFSTCPRRGNRNQAVERHQSSPHIHAMHIQMYGEECEMCKILFKSGEWHDDMVVETTMRLRKKEMFNAITKQVVVESVKKRKRRTKKVTKRRKRQKGL
ncbi:MAG: hypothetical protein CMP20_15325 [Rickettsiales bacterium]|nr:hypothetical protein [Rickettsiales bacterium]